LAAAADRLDWLTDPRFADYADRRANWDKLMDELEAWSKKLGNIDCLKALNDNGVPAAAYRTVREAMNDPQLVHRNAFSEVRDGGGSFRALNPPFRMSVSAVCAGTHAPALGEHTGSVLRAAGFSDAEIDALSNAAGPADR
jgi:CoA:oxalate CoA-transferase